MASVHQARRPEIVALALVAISLILLTLSDDQQRTVARHSGDVLLFPLVSVRSALSGHWDLREENLRLREALQRARLEIASAALAQRQNTELRRLLAFSERQPVRLVPARIVDRNFGALPTTAVLDVGRKDGVTPNLPVVTDRGLAGKTVATGSGLTRVMLFSHPDFSASALLVGGDHLEYGIVRPAGGGILQLFLPLRSKSAPGDRIVTSGYGGTFPRGIPIGEVAAVEEDPRLGLQRIDRVDPTVELEEATVVFVMLREGSPGESAGDETGLFWPGYAYPPMTGERFGSPPADSLVGDSLAADSLAVDSLAADSLAADSIAPDSAAAAGDGGTGGAVTTPGSG
ncbi:MAG: rod shape-determining protein MreC [Gemmatimonadota bacterium]